MTDTQESRMDFTEQLFEYHPGFQPGESLYLDLEGSGDGNEEICSFYWQKAAKPFEWEVRDPELDMINPFKLVLVPHHLGIDPDQLKWITVFSPGMEEPEERARFENLFAN